jgi:hypothetical protein
MKKITIAVIGLLFSLNSYAIGLGNDQAQGQSQGQGQGQAQGQLQGQAQGQLQGQSQGQTAIGAGLGVGLGVGIGGSQGQSSVNDNRSSAANATAVSTTSGAASGSSIVNNIPTTPDKLTINSVGQAPDILATPTAPCRIAVGVSVGMIGGSAGFGYSVEDEGCTMRENARLLNNLGQKDAALKLLCNDPKVAAVLATCAAK